LSFAPVGVNNAEQLADFGDVMDSLGITPRSRPLPSRPRAWRRELLWAYDRGIRIPPYVLRAFRDAADAAYSRRHGDPGGSS